MTFYVYSYGPPAVSLLLNVSPVAPSPSPPYTNGQLVATLTAHWTNAAPFTGTYQFAVIGGVIQDHGGDYQIVSNQLQVANAANLNAVGSITVQHVRVVAVQ